jgi:hypothetical protein
MLDGPVALADTIGDRSRALWQGMGADPRQHVGGVAEHVGDSPQLADAPGAGDHVWVAAVCHHTRTRSPDPQPSLAGDVRRPILSLIARMLCGNVCA